MTPDALRYPWTTPTNLATAQAERAAERWVVKHGLLYDETIAARYRGVSVGLLAGMTHPSVEPALLELIAQVMAWIFIEDDHYDAGSARSSSEALDRRFRDTVDQQERVHTRNVTPAPERPPRLRELSNTPR